MPLVVVRSVLRRVVHTSPRALAAGVLLSQTIVPCAAALLERGDPASRVARGAASTESWDVTAQFESQHWVSARFMITNDGPGEHTGVAIGHVVFPDGRVARFRNGRLDGRWTLAPDGRMLTVGSSELDLHQPRRLDIDSNKQGIKIHLRFGAGEPAPALEQVRAPAFWLDLIQDGTPIEGTLWTRGMSEPATVRGRVALTHTWTDMSTARTVHRQIELHALLGDRTLYMVIVTPPGNSASQQWLAVSRDGTVLYQTSDFELALGAALPATVESVYPVPQTIRIRSAALTADIRSDAELVRTDPLEVIPNPFRFLVSLTSKPQRLWLRAHCDVKLTAAAGQPSLDTHGPGLITASFSNPFTERP